MQRLMTLWERLVHFCFWAKGSYNTVIWKVKDREKVSMDVRKPEEESMSFTVDR